LLEIIKLCSLAILEEVEEEINKKTKRIWVSEWIQRRELLGDTNVLLRELELEDPKEYFATLRMTECCFNFLLNKIQSKIQRNYTHLRNTVPAETKLQTVLYFLATGCSERTQTRIFRLGKSTSR